MDAETATTGTKTKAAGVQHDIMDGGANAKSGEATVAADTDSAADVLQSAEESEGVKPLGSRAPRVVQASRPLHLSWQIGVFVVGLAVVIAGAVMLVVPGPGWLTIFAGMAIWATEFAWAQRVMRWTKRKLTVATEWWKRRRAERKARKGA